MRSPFHLAGLLTPWDDDTWDSLPTSQGRLLAAGALAGSTAAPGYVVNAPAAPARAVAATPAIAFAAGSVLAGPNQAVAVGSLFAVGSSPANPAYLIVSGLDRNEYTVGYKTAAMGHLAGAGASQGFSNFGGDGWSVSVVFTYQTSTGQYTNPSFGNLSQLAFKTGSNRGDTATISVFGTSNAALANAYAGNPLILATNPAYFTDYGSVAVVTGAAASTPPVAATPDSVKAAALGYVGQVWNNEGCWVLASDISAQAGATLPLTSSCIGVPGIGNGEWFVAYNGPVAASANWVNLLTGGEMVSFQTTYGGGHITTVASGQGGNAVLVDNITYVDSRGNILDSAHDGSANDIVVQAPHSAMQEFSGVNPATVVVYELDTPVVTDVVANVRVSVGESVSLAGDFTATDPKPGQSVTQYQVYETNAADTLSVSGVANRAATSAATACTVSSLVGLKLTAGAAGADTVEVRASNGSYWGDWTALTVTAAAAPMTVAAALGSTGTGPLSVADTAVNISAAADKLQGLAASGRLTAVSVAGNGLVSLTAGQMSSDQGLLHLLPAVNALQVGGATVAQAGALQGNAQVAQFAVTDTAADMNGHAAALGGNTKLTAVSVTGTAGSDTLNLTGIRATETINLSGNAATGTLSWAKLGLSGAPDAITLGAGPATITAGISGASGVATIAGFQFGLDALQLNLGALPSVQAFDTSYNGAHAIALTGGNYSEGVVLLNQPASVTAAGLMAGHLHISGGVATIS
jgi:hypothetical protein